MSPNYYLNQRKLKKCVNVKQHPLSYADISIFPKKLAFFLQDIKVKAAV